LNDHIDCWQRVTHDAKRFPKGSLDAIAVDGSLELTFTDDES